MKKVLWVSRHSVHDSQRYELKRLYGEDVEILINKKSVSNAQDILKEFDFHKCEIMVIVAPLSVMEVILRERPDLTMLWSDCIEENDPDKIEFRGVRGQGFKFVKFKKIVEIKKVLVDIEPE